MYPGCTELATCLFEVTKPIRRRNQQDSTKTFTAAMTFYTKDPHDTENKELPWVPLKYGFNAHYQNCTAKDPGMPRENYRLHHSDPPIPGMQLKDLKSGRTFTLEINLGGFLHFNGWLVENGKRVAVLYWESYYKD